MQKINSIIKNVIRSGIFLTAAALTWHTLLPTAWGWLTAGQLWSCAAALCGYVTAAGFIAFLDDLRNS
jgi:hypothetical protein